jgi:hypothetical protein
MHNKKYKDFTARTVNIGDISLEELSLAVTANE